MLAEDGSFPNNLCRTQTVYLHPFTEEKLVVLHPISPSTSTAGREERNMPRMQNPQVSLNCAVDAGYVECGYF